MPVKINPQTNVAEYSTGEDTFSILSADATVVSSATPVASSELSFQLAKYQRINFNFELHFTSVAAAGFRWLLTVPTGTLTQARLFREYIAPDALTTLVVAYDNTIDGTTNRTITHASGTDGFVRGTGVIHNGPNAGLVGISFAQNASNAGSTILRAGSFLASTAI